MIFSTIFWDDISYLNRGSDRQRDAYQALIELDLLSLLADYDPLVTGTFPLALETPESNLDIICNVNDLDHFAQLLDAVYGYLDEYRQQRSEHDGLPTLICNFIIHDLPVEIFAQARPTTEQRAYRHMVAEARLLREGGEDAVAAIRQLKHDGVATEPAFGDYFCLEGDPYTTLLELTDATAEALTEVVVQARVARRNRPQLLISLPERT